MGYIRAQMCQDLQLFYKVQRRGSRCQSKALLSSVSVSLIFPLFRGFLGNEVNEALKFPLGESISSKSAKPQTDPPADSFFLPGCFSSEACPAELCCGSALLTWSKP